MDKKEFLRVLPIGLIAVTSGFVAVNNQVVIDPMNYDSQPEAIMPQPTIIPGRGFTIKLK